MMHKKIFALILLVLFFSYITIYAVEDNEITQNCIITTDKGIDNITDGKYSTSINMLENESINIQSPKEIKAIYVLWDELPNIWSINANNIDNSNSSIKNYNSTDDIYLHQLIKINNKTNSLKLKIDKGSCKIAEIYVFSEGELPKWVQKWNEPYKKSDMLLLSTHADDEHIFFGGTMPYYAGELKLKVQVAYLTNHYNFRTHELLNGLWAVGIKAYPIIPNFCDYYASSLEEAKKLYNEDEILSYQVELLRRFKPSVVIGHDLNGEYGHGVHMLNSNSLIKALEMSNDSTIFAASAQKYGVWNVPKCYLHLYKKNMISMNWDKPLKNFDGKTAFEMATEGFSHHRSQLEFFSVGKKGVFDCRAFGLYRSIAGEDKVKNDFFENIYIKKRNSSKFIFNLER